MSRNLPFPKLKNLIPSTTVVSNHASTKRPPPPRPVRPASPLPAQSSATSDLPANFVGRIQNVESTITFLRGIFIGRHMEISLRALGYMQQHHAGQTRRDGQPYIIHPLSMVSHAMSINDPNITDELIAVQLLHDVCEDTGVPINELPFPSIVKNGVKYMSLTRFDDESKYSLKRRYYNELLESKEATIGKGFDRYNNLTTMSATFEENKIRKNVVETDLLLLPTLKRAENLWPEASNLLRLLRMSIRGINDIYALAYHVQLTDKRFVNPPDSIDYSHLLTDAD